jgi:hypothetical protein
MAATQDERQAQRDAEGLVVHGGSWRTEAAEIAERAADESAQRVSGDDTADVRGSPSATRDSAFASQSCG